MTLNARKADTIDWDDEEWDDNDWENEWDYNMNNKIKIKSMKDVFIPSPIKKIKFTSHEVSKIKFDSIERFMKIENGQEAYLGAYAEVEFFAYRFLQTHGFYPDLMRFSDIKTNIFIRNLFKHLDIPENSYYKSISSNNKGIELNSIMFCIKDGEDTLYLYVDDVECYMLYNKKHEKNKESVLQLIIGLIKGCTEPKISHNKIYVVYQTQHGFDKTGFDIKKVNVNLEENYNDGFVDIAKTIVTGLNNKNKTNLVLLQGCPGSGKTSFLRYLTSKIKKNIIFISPEMVHSITDPGFIPFLIKNNDAVLIVEDAETAIKSRDDGARGGAVANILNLTDGLLSDCLNISIVATFNTSLNNVDTALLRKGRLLMNYNFEKLNITKSKALLTKLGKNADKCGEPMTLADIYFYDTDNNVKTTVTKKVGFGK